MSKQKQFENYRPNYSFTLSKRDFVPVIGLFTVANKYDVAEKLDPNMAVKDDVKAISTLAYQVITTVAVGSYIFIQPLQEQVNNWVMQNIPLVESTVHVAKEFFRGF